MSQPTAEELAALLRRRRVMDMPALCRAFPQRSQRSLIRDLNAIGYLSSCNNSGGFYTHPDIPEFDDDGLWHHEQALFSRYGSLKATVRHLVRTAESGQTERDLHRRLQLRVHNTLLDLVSAQEIARELIDKLFLYVSADLEVQAAQLARRRWGRTRSSRFCSRSSTTGRASPSRSSPTCALRDGRSPRSRCSRSLPGTSSAVKKTDARHPRRLA